MNRRRSATIGTFAMVLISSPLTSGASASTASPAPTTEPAAAPALPLDATADLGKVTPSMQAEIDRVLAEGRTVAPRQVARTDAAALVSSQVRCADLEGQRYCLGTGWTDEPESEVQAEATASARVELGRTTARSAATESTGDLTLADQLRQRAALPAAQRQKVERAELVSAARSVAKVWLLRHQIQGKPLPKGFVERHPEIHAGGSPLTARTTTAAASTTAAPARKTSADYPEAFKILDERRVAEQTKTYWCGPTSMQMIGWGWRGYRNTQNYWASKLGTTSSGTAISEMVRVTNANTGFDNANRAGAYVVLNVGNWTWGQWWLLQMRHIYDYRAPVILHPILLKRFYPYLDDDASGHFQVGRGYDKNGNGGRLLKYFEPWNQQRFDPSEPFISRTQTRYAYRSYRANLAHSMHNIGV